MKKTVDAAAAKRKVLDYCLRKGALCAGIADLDAINRVAPAGHRPADLMPKVKSVISIGVGGNTRGAWGVSAKALTFFGSTEARAYKIAYGLAFYIEHTFGIPAVYCPPDMDSEAGARVPFQSLKLHAELAGLGARSLAGDILLHPQFGYMYFASAFTELFLAPDEPLKENPCPAPSCVAMYREVGKTPCMKFCPVQCLSGKLDEDGRQAEMYYDMAACAEMSQQFEAMPKVLAEAMHQHDPQDLDDMLALESKLLFYKLSTGSHAMFGQCFECMRVCPIATKAPLADPILRSEAARAPKPASAARQAE
jgi:epoxyqueuosine reductase QueG